MVLRHDSPVRVGLRPRAILRSVSALAALSLTAAACSSAAPAAPTSAPAAAAPSAPAPAKPSQVAAASPSAAPKPSALPAASPSASAVASPSPAAAVPKPSGVGGAPTTSPAATTDGHQLVLDAEKALDSWQPTGTPFDASKAKGKSIWYVSLNLSIPFEQVMVQGMTEGAATVGATVTGFDGKSQASEFTRGIQEAIQAKAGVIFLGGIEPTLVEPAIQAAKDAGIPVIAANTQDPGPPRADYPAGIVGIATHSFSEPGRVEADFIADDSKGNANVIFIESSDIGTISGLERDAFTNELKRLCATCKTQTVDVPSSQWNNLTPRTSSLIAANPDANYLVPVFDGMVIFMVPGVTSAGAESKVKIVSFNATPSVMEDLKQGNVVAAETGGPNLLQAWGFADEALRVLAGVPPLNDIGVPNRLFVPSNVAGLDLQMPEWSWYGNLDFQNKYKALWGVT
jgi:ribose transport system substrate-binding protein